MISKFEISEQDLLPFMPLQNNELKKEDPLHVHYLGYYLKWHPQECYYFAVDKGGFQASQNELQGRTLNIIP